MTNLYRALALAALATGLLSACATGGGHGPLTVNKDFYFAQDGQPAPTQLAADGTIEIQLRNAPFQIGHNGRQLNLALAQVPITEISTDPKGFKASRLSGPMAGGREPDMLLVYSGQKWSDGNSEFSDETSRRTQPLPGFKHAYEVNTLLFVADPGLTLEKFTGTVHGFIVVYRQPERRDQDILPVRLTFAAR